MSKSKKEWRQQREGEVRSELPDGTVVYDPTEAVEEYAANSEGSRLLGGFAIGESTPLDAKEYTVEAVLADSGEADSTAMDEASDLMSKGNSATIDGSNSMAGPQRSVSVAKQGEEKFFALLKRPVVLPVSANSLDEALHRVRSSLQAAGLRSNNFASFDVTTHSYYDSFGLKRECGWSFTFHSSLRLA